MLKRKNRMLPLALVLCLAVFVGRFLPAHADAAGKPEDSLVLSAVVGLDGYYKSDKWTQIKVLIANRGSDFQGIVRIVQESGKNLLDNGVYEQPVTVKAGQTATVYLTVPGSVLPDAKLILLNAGELIEELRLQGKPIQDRLVGTLGEPGLFSFFAKPTDTDAGTTVIRPLDPADIVTASGLDSLDLLVINNPADDTLLPEALQAIRQWVERGGTLLIAGSPAQADRLAVFQDLLAIRPMGQKVSDLQTFTRYAEAPPLSGKLAVAVGELRNARPLVEDGETTLVAARPVGNGHVLQAAYDLLAEPLASWKGNADFWRYWLSATDAKWAANVPHDPVFASPLVNASRYFPQLKLVPVTANTILFAVYLVLAGPGVYWILRRKDKREWGWVTVPCLAILLTGGILATGYAIRGTAVYNQAVGVVRITDPHWARVEAIHSFIVPSGGSYRVETVSGTTIQPLLSGETVTQAIEPGITVSLRGGIWQVDFQNVDYMSIRSAFIRGTVRDAGAVEGHLTLKNRKLVGELTNRSKFDLRDVRLWIGTKPVILPDLPVEKKLTVDVPLTDDLGVVPVGKSGAETGQLLPIGLQGSGSDQRYMNIANYFRQFDPVVNGQIVLTGWSENPLPMATVKDQPNERGALYLVSQNLPLQLPSNEKIRLTNELLESRILESSGNSGKPGYSVAREGRVTFEFQTPPGYSLEIDSLQLRFDQPDFRVIQKQIYNWQTGRWEPLAQQEVNLTGERLGQYVNQRNQARIRLFHDPSDPLLIPEPRLVVEGETRS